MKAMVMTGVRSVEPGSKALELREVPTPEPGPGEVRIRVLACGVCHTELDELEGRTPPPSFPMVLGHEVVGVVDALGSGVGEYAAGDRVGVGWFHSACGRCGYCERGLPNLCADFKATGRDVNGGYAEYLTAPVGSAYPIPDTFDDAEAAPLLCAGGVGHRALALTGLRDGQNLGFYGFGASAHLVLQMARYEYPHSQLFVFTRTQSKEAFARDLGADWAGPPVSNPPGGAPAALDAIIDTTPVWSPLAQGLPLLAPAGRFVINAIRKTDADKNVLTEIDYESHLWMEREIKSVANVAPADIRRALEVSAKIQIKPTVSTYSLEQANEALVAVKKGEGHGAAVLTLG